MIEMIKQTKEDLKSHLKEQIQFLLRSGQSYDEGFTSEAKRLAVVIRVLLHDTRRSISLLKLLEKKNILFYDTAYEYDPYNLAPTTALVMMGVGPEGAKYIPPLDDDMRAHLNDRKVSFEKWWNKIVIADTNGNKLTRKDLILSVANTDGGAHIDPKLNKDYATLTKFNSLGWKYVSGEVEEDLLGSELASIRQINHEVLKSLKVEFPELFDNIKVDLKFSIRDINDSSKPHKKEIDYDDELDADSFRTYLKTSKTVEYWASYIESLGIKIEFIGVVSRNIEMLKMAGIETLAELDNLLEKSKEWGEKYLNGVYINICWEVSRERLSTDRSGIVSHFLIANFPDIFTDDILEMEFGYGNPEYFTIPAKMYNQNYQS